MAAAKWQSFFKDAGIPNEPASNYAVIFTDNRMRMDMLNELTKDILADLGVNAMGDVIAVLRHSKKVYAEITRSKAEDFDVNKTSSPEQRKRTADKIYSNLIEKPATPPILNIESEPKKTHISKSLQKKPVEKEATKLSRSASLKSTKNSSKSLSERFSAYDTVPVKKKKSVSDEVMTISVSNDTKQRKMENESKIPAQKEPNLNTSIKKTVFDRLGSEQEAKVPNKVDQGKSLTQKISRITTKNTSSVKETKSTGSVFDRLGGNEPSVALSNDTSEVYGKIPSKQSKQIGKSTNESSFTITLGKKSSVVSLGQHGRQSIMRPIKSVKPIPRKPLAMDIEASGKTKIQKQETLKSDSASKSEKIVKTVNQPKISSKSVFERLGK